MYISDTDNCIDLAIQLLAKLKGLGPNSAKRMVLDLMKNNENFLVPLVKNLQELSNTLAICNNCKNIDLIQPCAICQDTSRDQSILCIVDDVSALWSIEKTQFYHGKYFVLGGLLSATKGFNTNALNLDILINAIKLNDVQEVILATPLDIEGQITANYLKELIHQEIHQEIKFSVLAQGIPIGSDIEYLDQLTLTTAIKTRKYY